KFQTALDGVCADLALQIVADGEGVKHIVELVIEKARTESEALQIAHTVATSPLVKTAWAGADPNWGRILAAVGRSGVPLDPSRVHIDIGDQRVCHNGSRVPFDTDRAHQTMLAPQYSIRIDLNRGRAGTRFFSGDLTEEYVHINA